jgi:amino-acid N-acetyltransferase
MMARVIVRPALRDDWPAVAALLDDNGLPQDGAREHLADFRVATLQGPVVACIGLEIFGAIALLHSVAVAPLLQGQAIGKILLNGILEQARTDGISQIYLLTLTAADHFRTMGFAQIHREEAPPPLLALAEFISACPAMAVLMRLDLQAAPRRQNRD